MLRTTHHARLGALILLVGLTGCPEGDADPGEALERTGEALQKTGEVVSEGYQKAKPALEKTGEVIADGVEKAAPVLNDAGAYARTWLPEMPTSGELSAQAETWIKAGAGDEARVEYWLGKGRQALPPAKEIAKTLNQAVERDYLIEPIFRPFAMPGGSNSAAEIAKVDATIEAMPRVEVIEGLTVGFRKLSADDSEGREKQTAFLVLWRMDQHLVGFVFRSRRKIRVDQLVVEAPRLVSLVKAAVE